MASYLIASLGSRAFSVGLGAGFWLPRQGSTGAARVDSLFHAITWISICFFALIVSLLAVFLWKYRSRPGHTSQPSPTHNTPLEITWTVLPVLIVVWIFWEGFTGFIDLATPPDNAYEVQVLGQKWNWTFTYPNGVVSPDLHVPVDTDVRLVMTSQDVIHSLYVPDFRIKRDVVPGRYEKAWFHATDTGDYQLYCAEYCGTQHSSMLAKVVVQSARRVFEVARGRRGLHREAPSRKALRRRAEAVQPARLQAMPLDRRLGRHRPDVQGRLGAPGRSARWRKGRGRRKLRAGIRPGPGGEGGGRLRAGDAVFQGAPEGQGDHRHHRIPEDPGLGGGEAMSVVEGPAAAGTRSAPPPKDHYLNHTRGFASWAFTLDHKRIGIMYLVSTLAAFLIGGLAALAVRTELIARGPTLMDADTYNKIFTMHGAVMVFLFIIPSIPAALGNFVLPLMLGAKDVAFPRMNLASYWLWVLGSLFAVGAIVAGGVDTGWTFYTPYSTTTNTHVVATTFGAFILGSARSSRGSTSSSRSTSYARPG
jgi:cytochrome c oxidase subunit II